MLARLAADAVLLAHLAFVLFVLLGGLLVLRWPRLAWLHVPAAFWGALVEVTGWICPLTPLEVVLRRSAGEAGYSGGFVQHYIVGVLYPHGLTRDAQFLFAALVVVVNALVYAVLLMRVHKHRPHGTHRP